ncbi:MAG: hypothetical protein HC919_04710 [Oscillatoriales cyanobacterium SM2_2_1]|nr:hypothetical protein [Oscillatoriales cyanobacterium SM2_2_1]
MGEPSPSPKSWRMPFFVLPVVVIAFLGVVVGISTQMLTDLQSTPSANCTRDDLAGTWQVTGGTLMLKSEGDRWVGTYTLLHDFRGTIKGKLTGTLESNLLQFTWQETAQWGGAQQGDGFFVFQQKCRQFYGSATHAPHQQNGEVSRWQGQKR